jgi:hypothetical protein
MQALAATSCKTAVARIPGDAPAIAGEFLAAAA